MNDDDEAPCVRPVRYPAASHENDTAHCPVTVCDTNRCGPVTPDPNVDDVTTLPAADRSVFDVRFPNASYAKSVHPGAGPPTCDHDVGIASTSIDTSLADHSAHALW